MKKAVSIAGACVLSASFALSAWGMGGPEDQSEDIFNLGEVVVSGRPDGIEAAETVHVINEEQIKKSNARTLDEALELLSDVNVQTGNDGVPRVEIRGFKTRQILLLLNGIPMNAAFDQQFNAAAIPVENIAQIKVTAGASSVLYGQGGLGGVINIITKKGMKGVNATVAAESGDGAPYLVKSTLSGGKGMWDYFLSGSVYRRDHFPVASPIPTTEGEGQGYRKNSDSSRYSGFFNIGFNPTNDFSMAITGSYTTGSYGKPASAINNKFDPYAPKEKYGRVDWFDQMTLQLAIDYAVTRALSLRATGYYNQVDEDDNQYDDENYGEISSGIPDSKWPFIILAANDDISNSYKIRNQGLSRGVTLQPKYDFGTKGTVTVGLSAQWDTLHGKGLLKPGGQGGALDENGNYTGGGASGGGGVGGGSPPYNLFQISDVGDVYLYSAALEYSVPLTEKWGFAAGYGHHWQHQGGALSSIKKPINMGPQPREITSRTLEDYSVSVSTFYDPYKSTRLKAAFMRNVRFPSLSQLYKRDQNNPFLRQEVAYHYQLGAEQKLPYDSNLRIDLFRSDLHDFIAVNQNIQPPKNWNYSLYRFTGFETTLETHFLPKLALKGSYTLNISEDLSGVGRAEVQYTPRDKFTLIGKYDFDFGLTTFASLVYAANSYVYSKQQTEVVPKKPMNDYAVVNVKLTQKFFKDKLHVYLGVDNLFNEDYEQSYGVPKPGRFLYGGLEYSFAL